MSRMNFAQQGSFSISGVGKYSIPFEVPGETAAGVRRASGGAIALVGPWAPNQTLPPESTVIPAPIGRASGNGKYSGVGSAPALAGSRSASAASAATTNTDRPRSGRRTDELNSNLPVWTNFAGIVGTARPAPCVVDYVGLRAP